MLLSTNDKRKSEDEQPPRIFVQCQKNNFSFDLNVCQEFVFFSIFSKKVEVLSLC